MNEKRIPSGTSPPMKRTRYLHNPFVHEEEEDLTVSTTVSNATDANLNFHVSPLPLSPEVRAPPSPLSAYPPKVSLLIFSVNRSFLGFGLDFGSGLDLQVGFENPRHKLYSKF